MIRFGYAVVLVTVATATAYFAAMRMIGDYYADQGRRTKSAELLSYSREFDRGSVKPLRDLAELRVDANDYEGALIPLSEAVRLKENDYVAWLQLGYAEYRRGHNETALAAYDRALALAPNYAEPNRLKGRLLLRLDDPTSGFELLSRSAEADPTLTQELLQLLRAKHPTDGAEIARLASPKTAAGKKLLASYLLKHRLLTPELTDFVKSSALTNEEKSPFITTMLRRGDVASARGVWVSTLPAESQSLAAENFIDGDFEFSTFDGDPPFGWRLNKNAGDVAAIPIASDKFSGSRALKISVSGQAVPGRHVLSQLLIPEKNRRYRLRFSERLTSLTSYSGFKIAVREFKTGNVLGESAEILQPATNWRTSQFEFTTTDDAIVITLEKMPCKVSPCPAFADLLLDSFKLELLN